MERVDSEPPLSPYLIAVLTAGAILVAVLAIDRLEQQRYDKVCEAPILRSLSNSRARLEGELNERLFLTRVKEANVCVMRKETAVVIEAEDHGKGFAPDKLELPRARGGGFGLFSIRERLSLLGGRLEIDSKPGGGTFAQVFDSRVLHPFCGSFAAKFIAVQMLWNR